MSIRVSEVVEPREALEAILDIMSRYSSFTAADLVIIRTANHGLLGKDPYGRNRVDLLTEEEATSPTFLKWYYEEAGSGYFNGRKYPNGECSCHSPGKKCNYGEPYNPFTNPYPTPANATK